jgi:hypothetical protein
VATVYKRNSTYWMGFQWHGKEVRQSALTTSKATAQQSSPQLLDEHYRLDIGGCGLFYVLTSGQLHEGVNALIGGGTAPTSVPPH